MDSFSKSRQSGASLIVLLVVMAIGAVLFTVAASQFCDAGDNLIRHNVAREFKVSLERARFDSVKRRASNTADMSTVTVLSATSFSYAIDFNQNGVIDNPGETRLVDFASRSNVKITGTNFVFPITIRFDRRGHVTVTNGDIPATDISSMFYFCNGSCTVATANPQNSNIIYVSPTGTVAMMKGGDTIPIFDDPGVTAVNSNTAINPLLAVWIPGSPTPTPTATPTPIPTATPTSTPTGSPTGTPVASPSPTATPLTCAYGQKPATTGCVCRAPRWVRANGKCQ
jgi:Tfp pilus assembly protein FimT